MLKWFKVREVAEAGTALADELARPSVTTGARGKKGAAASGRNEAIRAAFRRVVRDPRIAGLNFFKRAWLANSFKWRLLESGVDAETANEWTQTLVLEIASKRSKPAAADGSAVADLQSVDGKARKLAALADAAYSRGDYAESVTYLQDLVALKPHDVVVLVRLGDALIKVGRYPEAEGYFRKAIRRRPNHAEAHGNLGALYLASGQYYEAEGSLRRALDLKPADLDYRCHLGMTLVNLNRLQEANAQFERVLKVAPRHCQSLVGMGLAARAEGRFDAARILFDRALQADPMMPSAWAALAGLRKMGASDSAWIEHAERIVASGVAPMEEATLRFAMGKYYDDVQDFQRAFKSYERANELQKSVATRYQPEVASRFTDDLMRVYTPRSFAALADGGSISTMPVFVVGMLRSGTSLVEQIIASHPRAAGAGELTFWNDVIRKHEALIRTEPLGKPLRDELARQYLRCLTQHSKDAVRVVDKAPMNSDFLGVIHSVFPRARIIYMQRNPIDTCLSCYFQPLAPSLSFAMDLSDLAHRYREHQRLMAHWRAVLPAGTVLSVPYAELVADQQGWTRRILDFVGLEWDPRCLDFHMTNRTVATASDWQVRQRLYTGSVERWRNYRKFVGPLLELEKT